MVLKWYYCGIKYSHNPTLSTLDYQNVKKKNGVWGLNW